ncbi:MAG: class I SAM-dependent methyltransferase [Pirellulales bacterium]|nr:class I SAM-dependent methyltransferase [Pirellulales bacterium]
MRKFEVVQQLSARFGYRRYLEICTPTTGATFAEIKAEQFPTRVRCMYRCPADYDDGLQLDVRTEAESSEPLYARLMQSGRRFDAVFVDPFHTHACTLRDLVYGLQVLNPTGVMVVHDCSPPCAEWSTPEFIAGNWCGITYAAFLDVVLGDPALTYFTVDCDFGCGVVLKSDGLLPLVGTRPDRELVREWFALELADKYPFFDRHRADLLQLRSVDEFHQLVDGTELTDSCREELRAAPAC